MPVMKLTRLAMDSIVSAVSLQMMFKHLMLNDVMHSFTYVHRVRKKLDHLNQ